MARRVEKSVPGLTLFETNSIEFAHREKGWRDYLFATSGYLRLFIERLHIQYRQRQSKLSHEILDKGVVANTLGTTPGPANPLNVIGN